MSRFAGKKVVITGGTHGMGLDFAKALIAEGAEVLVTGRNEKNIEAARDELKENAHVVRSDAGSVSDIEALAKIVAEKFGKIDHVFLNAGLAILETIDKFTEDTFDRQYAVNTKGVFFAVKHLAPLVQSGGSITITTSVANSAGAPGMGVYGGAKAAVRAFVRVAASELVAQGVRVNAVSPGFIHTPSMGIPEASPEERAQFQALGDILTPMKRHGSMEEVTKAALFLAADATFTSGLEFTVDGGGSQGVLTPQ
ncbi:MULTISPECIES: SDR family oxidoreductase [Streptomyces]|uniref:SDR family oxidoreductase n=1 Tax=Streptomyces TaxID=1883 RepID=UPI000BF1F120|nr:MULTISPECIES: SDR family oxidoreductase [unclassified Streptomyces]WTE27846.1 SDR family oxidoreductase [Streptomyces anulatus]